LRGRLVDALGAARRQARSSTGLIGTPERAVLDAHPDGGLDLIGLDGRVVAMADTRIAPVR
jgi:hypothetical protein